MPRNDDPRIVIRLSPEDHAVIKAAADMANVAMGALMRECSVRHASQVAADVRRGTTRLRRATAVEATKGQVQTASSLVVRPVSDHDQVMRERQQRVNALGKPKAVRRQVP